jgi:hypothetical protein
MNDPTSTKNSSTPSKSREHSHRVEAQLASRRKAKTEATSEIMTAPVSEIEIDPASTLPPLEKPAFLPLEAAKPVEIVDGVASAANRKMMAKVGRAFRKADKPEASDAEISAFLASLLETKVPVLNRSSGRIARVIKGEQSIESLLLARVPTKSA